jgi:hypothetical protein
MADASWIWSQGAILTDRVSGTVMRGQARPSTAVAVNGPKLLRVIPGNFEGKDR